MIDTRQFNPTAQALATLNAARRTLLEAHDAIARAMGAPTVLAPEGPRDVSMGQPANVARELAAGVRDARAAAEMLVRTFGLSEPAIEAAIGPAVDAAIGRDANNPPLMVIEVLAWLDAAKVHPGIMGAPNSVERLRDRLRRLIGAPAALRSWQVDPQVSAHLSRLRSLVLDACVSDNLASAINAEIDALRKIGGA